MPLVRVAVLAALLVATVAMPARGSDPCRDPEHEDYRSHACKVERLRERSFAVVAVVDRGVNPYHLDFRLPPDEDLVGVHPSEFIEGYPKDTPALELSLGAPSYSTAVARDSQAWASVRNDRMMWIPGTNVIGAIGKIGGASNETFLDPVGHGTATSSLAGGLIHGPRSPSILLVVVREYTQGIAWAARQPWIDVITNSWLHLESGDTTAVARESYEAVARGKVVCFASMNYGIPMIAASSQGPSWNVNVGAASFLTRGEHYYSGYPNDVLGLSGGMAADHDSIDGEIPFAGTSASAPNVCGLIGVTLANLRAAIGDTGEGSRDGALAHGPSRTGPLADGKLSRLELEDAVQATAVPAQASAPDPLGDPNAIPAAPVAGFVRGGYGIVDGATTGDALAVLLGTRPRPERQLEDAWIAATDSARDSIWGPPPP